MVTLDMGASANSYTDYVKMLMNLITALVIAGSVFRATVTGISCLSNEQPLGDYIKKVKKIIYAAILCGGIPQILNLIANLYSG